jgi:VWFA-related protein
MMTHVQSRLLRWSAKLALPTSLLLALLFAPTAPLLAQDEPQAPAADGGPQGDVSPVVVPKKKEEPPPPPKIKLKNPEGMPDYSLTVDVPVVNVDALVTTSKGAFIPGLKRENFKIYEDGVPQTITTFSQSEAPITAVLLLEFASNSYAFINDMLHGAYGFASTLKANDYVAVISYDMRPEIQQDFTQDKGAVMAALNHLRIPGFRETNLFDSLYDTMDRMERIQGHKYIILISSGRDTFSKLRYDTVLKKVKDSKDITIFAIGTGQALRFWLDNHGAITPGQTLPGDADRMDYLQADNQMSTFARLTGGKAYFPMLAGEVGDIMGDISNTIRNQYSMSYHPSNPKQDGSYRKIKVELVDPASGAPLRVNENGKPVKTNIIARDGYTAKREVE